MGVSSSKLQFPSSYAELFGAVDDETYRARVEKELAGADYERALVKEIREGIRLPPLCGPEHRPPEHRLLPQGALPTGWWCIERYDDARSAAQRLENAGAPPDAVWLGDASGFERLFDGPSPPEAILLDGRGDVSVDVSRTGATQLLLCVDPFADQLRAQVGPALPAALTAAIETAKRYAGAPAVVPLMISSMPLHQAGGHGVDELGYLVSGFVALLRAAEIAGCSPEQMATQVVFTVGVGNDLFVEIAKLRAIRRLYVDVMTRCGVPSPPNCRIIAITSPLTQTVRDPYTNLLRATTQSFAAAVGGADGILTTPFYDAYDEVDADTRRLGRRMARNTQAILREESGLFHVEDPTRGSYYCEWLTEQLARRGYEWFQAIEKGGSLVDAIGTGVVQERVLESWKSLASSVARRKTPITGVTEYTNTSDDRLGTERPAPGMQNASREAHAPMPVHRGAEAFESLRSRNERQSKRAVLLVSLGAPSSFKPRQDFAQTFFEVAGFHVATCVVTLGMEAGERDAVVRDAIGQSEACLACLVGPDGAYATDGAGVAQSLKRGGVVRVGVAGRASDAEAALRDAGVDEFIFQGCDVLSSLTQWVDVVAGSRS